MPTVLFSTLNQIASWSPEHRQVCYRRFPILVSFPKPTKDIQIHLSNEQEACLAALIANPPYPHCSSCSHALSGNSQLCRCPKHQVLVVQYQHEYNHLLSQCAAAKHTLRELKQAPFRQLRNAYGFSTGLLSGINVLIANLPIMAFSITASILSLPTVLLGGFVYFRGRREERAMNADAEADLLAKQVSLLSKHSINIHCRFRNCQDQVTKTVHLQDNPITLIPVAKEKRSLFKNPLSHFIGASLATLGSLNIALKVLALPTLLGGPIAWTITACISVGVGCYFAHARYVCLKNKNTHESAANQLTAYINDIDKATGIVQAREHHRIQHQLQQLQKKVCNLTPIPAAKAHKASIPGGPSPVNYYKQNKDLNSDDTLKLSVARR